MHKEKAEKPSSGYLTDYQVLGKWRKVVKFSAEDISHFDFYEITVEKTRLHYINKVLCINHACKALL